MSTFNHDEVAGSIIRLTLESESESHSVMSNSLRPHGLYSPWDSPGQNTGVGNLSRLQGIFPTQGSNPGLLHCRQILYQLRHKGSSISTEMDSKSNAPLNHSDWQNILIINIPC